VWEHVADQFRKEPTMSYYKQIDGVSYDRALIEAAEAAVAGRGDGRISKADAETLLTFVIDGGKITTAEQATMVYLRDHFKWTDKADAWFKDAITRWEAGERPSTPAKPAATTPKGEPAVVVRIGSKYKTASFFPADAAAQAQGCAIVILSKVPGSTPLSAVWEKTQPNKVADLEKSVEVALCNSGSGVVRANVWRFARVLGSQNGMITWQSGFTNVPTEVLITALEELGFRVIEGETLA
jgi:hypothetical protein